jgi:hypothetical protein
MVETRPPPSSECKTLLRRRSHVEGTHQVQQVVPVAGIRWPVDSVASQTTPSSAVRSSRHVVARVGQGHFGAATDGGTVGIDSKPSMLTWFQLRPCLIFSAVERRSLLVGTKGAGAT